VYLNFN